MRWKENISKSKCKNKDKELTFIRLIIIIKTLAKVLINIITPFKMIRKTKKIALQYRLLLELCSI